MAKIKIQCEATARHSGKRCRCKGYFTPTSRRMLCTYHKGSKSWDHKTRKYKGLYRNNNIDIQSKINMLKNLRTLKIKRQMKSKDISRTKNKELTLSDTELNTIIDRIVDGETLYELAKDLQIRLTTLYKYLDQNPKTKERFELAQERGIKTLVEKMLVLFNNDNPDVDPNMLVFIRERANYLKWLAPRVSSLFTEKQKIDVKQDTTLNIKWESEPDMIDVSEDIVDIPSDNKD